MILLSFFCNFFLFYYFFFNYLIERKSTQSDSKQEVVLSDEFASLLNKLDILANRLEKSIAKTESLEPTNNRSSTAESLSTDSVSNRQPVFEITNNKRWRIENQTNRDDLIVDKATAKHSVSISNCHGCKVKVNSKINSILVEACNDLTLEVGHVNVSFELKQSQRVELIVGEELSTPITLDEVNNLKVHLNAKSINTTIESSRSFGISLLTSPSGNDNDNDQVAHSVPEKYKIKFNAKSKKINVNPIE